MTGRFAQGCIVRHKYDGSEHIVVNDDGGDQIRLMNRWAGTPSRALRVVLTVVGPPTPETKNAAIVADEVLC